MREIFEGAALCGLFVGGMYVWPAERKADYDRDDDKNIKRRLASVLGIVSVGATYVYFTRYKPAGMSVLNALRTALVGGSIHSEGTSQKKGLTKIGAEVLGGAGLTLTLFRGVVFEEYCDHRMGENVLAAHKLSASASSTSSPTAGSTDNSTSKKKNNNSSSSSNYITPFGPGNVLLNVVKASLINPMKWIFYEKPKEIMRDISTWYGIRNYIAAPIAEELFFRTFLFQILRSPNRLLVAPSSSSSSSPALLAATSSCSSTKRVVLLTAVLFASSHLHHVRRHYYAMRDARPDLNSTSWTIGACARSLGDFVITFTFGVLSGLLYAGLPGIMHENALATAICHSICNYLGAPTLSFWTTRSGTNRVQGGSRFWTSHDPNPERTVTSWRQALTAQKYIIAVGHLWGIYGFFQQVRGNYQL